MTRAEKEKLLDSANALLKAPETLFEWFSTMHSGYKLTTDDYARLKPFLWAEYKVIYKIGGVEQKMTAHLISGVVARGEYVYISPSRMDEFKSRFKEMIEMVLINSTTIALKHYVGEDKTE